MRCQDRKEQLALMKQAKAIIQPSLFEGWSTVVEDAKAMGQKIILSQLEVHLEQTEEYSNKLFFNPYDANDLADKIQLSLINNSNTNIDFDYKKNVKNFGECFVKLCET